jgi:hypothetical protein
MMIKRHDERNSGWPGSGVKVSDDDLAEVPALVQSLAGIVMPDTHVRQWPEALRDAQYELVDAASTQSLKTKPHTHTWRKLLQWKYDSVTNAIVHWLTKKKKKTKTKKKKKIRKIPEN